MVHRIFLKKNPRGSLCTKGITPCTPCAMRHVSSISSLTNSPRILNGLCPTFFTGRSRLNQWFHLQVGYNQRNAGMSHQVSSVMWTLSSKFCQVWKLVKKWDLVLLVVEPPFPTNVNSVGMSKNITPSGLLTEISFVWMVPCLIDTWCQESALGSFQAPRVTQ